MPKYLYNGIPLPSLPVNDKAYSLIAYDNNLDMYLLYNTDTQYRAMTPDGATIIVDAGYGATPDANEWNKRNNESLISPVIVWANYDVYYAEDTNMGELSGTLYLSASDPVPIPVLDIDHTALLQGYWVGKRLAAMRGKRTWETLYENESVRCYEYYPGKIGANFSLLATDEPLFTEETVLRLTVDDTVITETCTPTINSSGYYNYRIGNPWLVYPSSYEDDGRDYAIDGIWVLLADSYELYLYSRNVGTYNVKLERLVI